MAWVDPRTFPQPPFQGKRPPLAKCRDEIEPLIKLCESGSIYAVERWIQEGKPLQWVISKEQFPFGPTALTTAMGQELDDLVLLLLCNGYDPNADGGSPFDDALSDRQWRYVDLLWSWGADPKAADAELVLDTYTGSIITRFLDAGLDVISYRCLARCLGYHSRNRALYGIVRSRRATTPGFQDALNEGLSRAIRDKKTCAVALCVWAGADPRAPVVYRWSEADETSNDDPEAYRLDAIQLAIHEDQPQLLKILGFDPTKDDVQRLFDRSIPLESLRHLLQYAAPDDWGPIFAWRLLLSRPIGDDFRFSDGLELMSYINAGARLTKPNETLRQELPKTLDRLDEYHRKPFLRWLFNPQLCKPEVIADLLTRPVLRKRFQDTPMTQPLLQGIEKLAESYPAAAAFARWRLRDTAYIKRSYLTKPSADRPCRVTRQDLYLAIWERSVQVVAKEHGFSDNGLRKNLKALNIPCPPRGYWEKRQHGHRPHRPGLPRAKSGDVTEIWMAKNPRVAALPKGDKQTDTVQSQDEKGT